MACDVWYWEAFDADVVIADETGFVEFEGGIDVKVVSEFTSIEVISSVGSHLSCVKILQ